MTGDQDQLELELRQLPGVVVVAFGERDGAVLVEIGVDHRADRARVRAEATRLAAAVVEQPVLVEIRGQRDAEDHPEADAGADGAGSRLRVQLLGVTAAAGGQRVEVHLAHRGRRVSVSCRPGDSVGVAGAVLDGLGELGLAVPYEPASVHLLPDDLGSGVLVILRHRQLDGVRRGMAGGRWLEEAVARAVLNGLNRYLQPDAGREPVGGAGGDGRRPLVDLRRD